MLTPATITGGNLQTVNTNEIQELSEFRIEFKTPVPLAINCVIEIKFPSDLKISGSTLTSVRGVSLFGVSRDLIGSISKQFMSKCARFLVQYIHHTQWM